MALEARDVLNWRVEGTLLRVSLVLMGACDCRYGFGMYGLFKKNVLRECIAVDAAHGNAECTRLQDIVVGEALDQLQDW